MQSLLLKPLAVAGFLLYSTCVLAAPVTWQIDGVLFDADNTITTWTGSFVFDVDALATSNVMVETDFVGDTNGPTPTYLFGYGDGKFFQFSTIAFGNVQTGGFNLLFETANPLTNLGGTEAIGGSAEQGEVGCLNFNCTEWTSGAALFSGTVSTVPVPAAAWLFGSALLGLGALKRRSNS